MARRYDISYTDTNTGDRVRRGLKLTKKGARREISKLTSSSIFRSLKLSNPRMYKRNK